jgi:hypothetical protein
MNLRFLLIVLIICLVFGAKAQYKKNGTPDLRYNSNKQANVNNSITPKSISNTNTNIHYQYSYTKPNGSNVKPHYKTDSNNTNLDNFSTKDNYNYTNGTNGTKAKDYSKEALNYGSGKPIQTGTKGGQYYINSKGNKTYVPKR